jgi:hypothetical protein
MTCVERKFELQDRKCKWEEYKGNLSGLTFQVWDPSAGSDDTSAPVAMLVKSRRRGTEKSSGCGNSTFVLSVENDNEFRSRCE